MPSSARNVRALKSPPPPARRSDSTEEALKRIIERLLDALTHEYLSDRLRPVWRDAKRAVGREG